MKQRTKIRNFLLKHPHLNPYKFYSQSITRTIPFAIFRLPTAKQRMKPSFLILGAQKCGTTTLYEHITGNKQVLASTMKEIHYFDNNFTKNLNWYHAHFPLDIYNDHITGEATPFYLFHPLVAQRVKKTFPDIKLIIILRNPVKRAFSQYQHNIRLLRENLSFEKAVKIENNRLQNETITENKLLFSHWYHSYRHMGQYIEQLEHWLKYFKKEQLFITSLEMFIKSPQNTMDEIFSFLGLTDYDYFVIRNVENVGGYKEKINTETESELIEHFKPFNEKLFNFVGKQLWPLQEIGDEE